jgi:hypothetical protein
MCKELIKLINEVIETVSNEQIRKYVICLKDQLKIELENTANIFNTNDEEGKDRWGELRQIYRNLETYVEDGTFMMGKDEYNKFMNDFISDIPNINENGYSFGERVDNEYAKNLIKSNIKLFKSIDKGTNTTLFRGVSLKDWNRIKSQGYIDSDMRGAISNFEGINLSPNVRTAEAYLPNNGEGVIIAISPIGLDLYMLSDMYIRVFEPIPNKNIIKVSDTIKKNNLGATLSPNSNIKLDQIKQKLKSLGFNYKC